MIYLDASLLVAALTRESRSVAVRAWLQAQSAEPLSMSGWTVLETASGLSAKRRNETLTAPQHELALQLLDVVTSMNWRMFNVIAEDFMLARKWVGDAGLALKGGDALHLALASRRGLTVASLDKGMIKAARLLDIACAQLPD